LISQSTYYFMTVNVIVLPSVARAHVGLQSAVVYTLHTQLFAHLACCRVLRVRSV